MKIRSITYFIDPQYQPIRTQLLFLQEHMQNHQTEVGSCWFYGAKYPTGYYTIPSLDKSEG